jgi:hypothetical protein
MSLVVFIFVDDPSLINLALREIPPYVIECVLGIVVSLDTLGDETILSIEGLQLDIGLLSEVENFSSEYKSVRFDKVSPSSRIS